MKTWRIHLVWAIVTVLVAAVWGHLVASRSGRSGREDRVRGGRDLGTDRPEGARGSHTLLDPFGSGPLAKGSIPETLAPSPSPSPNPPDSEALTPEAIRVLLRDRTTWSKAFEALKRLESRSVRLGLLEEVITGKPISSAVPHSAINCLVEMGGADAAEILEKALRTPETEGICGHAARALGQVGDPRSVAALLDVYHSASLDLKVPCAAALHVLGQAGPASEVLVTLSRSLDDGDGGIRRDAVENISSMNLPSALPLLARALRDSNGDVRVAAINGLEALGTPEVVNLLQPVFNDANPSVAQEARDAVERLQKPKKK
jgi:HEAT repeat protein